MANDGKRKRTSAKTPEADVERGVADPQRVWDELWKAIGPQNSNDRYQFRFGPVDYEPRPGLHYDRRRVAGTTSSDRAAVIFGGTYRLGWSEGPMDVTVRELAEYVTADPDAWVVHDLKGNGEGWTVAARVRRNIDEVRIEEVRIMRAAWSEHEPAMCTECGSPLAEPSPIGLESRVLRAVSTKTIMTDLEELLDDASLERLAPGDLRGWKRAFTVGGTEDARSMAAYVVHVRNLSAHTKNPNKAAAERFGEPVEWVAHQVRQARRYGLTEPAGQGRRGGVVFTPAGEEARDRGIELWQTYDGKRLNRKKAN